MAFHDFLKWETADTLYRSYQEWYNALPVDPAQEEPGPGPRWVRVSYSEDYSKETTTYPKNPSTQLDFSREDSYSCDTTREIMCKPPEIGRRIKITHFRTRHRVRPWVGHSYDEQFFSCTYVKEVMTRSSRAR